MNEAEKFYIQEIKKILATSKRRIFPLEQKILDKARAHVRHEFKIPKDLSAKLQKLYERLTDPVRFKRGNVFTL